MEACLHFRTSDGYMSEANINDELRTWMKNAKMGQTAFTQLPQPMEPDMQDAHPDVPAKQKRRKSKIRLKHLIAARSPQFTLVWLKEHRLHDTVASPPGMDKTTLKVNRVLGRNAHSLNLIEVNGNAVVVRIGISVKGLFRAPEDIGCFKGQSVEVCGGYMHVHDVDGYAEPQTATISFRRTAQASA